ncbi:MAG: N-6 DNA methylase [Paludibacter sp.]|nr:N-6 DNA methylase [Paludibacter sp.]
MSYNKKAHLRANIEAIKLSFELEKEHRQPSVDERVAILRYSGFGGLKCILNPTQTLADTAYWAKSELDLFPLVAELQAVIRDNSGSEEQYKRYWGSLKNSILTSFYTPSEIVETLANSLRDSGITPTRFLDPSAGMGEFISAFQQIALPPDSSIMSFEKDLLTGELLSHLYPTSTVNINGFEEIESRYNNHFDVVSSNIPFGDVSAFDFAFSKSKDKAKQQSTRAIHNYFFIKGVDTLREGGILAFITSQGVMNAPQNELIRQWLMDNTNLVSAVRLPNNLFVDSANTEVGSDLIVLQKNSAKTELSDDEKLFVKSSLLSSGVVTNSYFKNFQRVVHTKGFSDTDQYGKPAMVYLHDGGVTGMATDLKIMLRDDFSNRLNLKLYEQYNVKSSIQQNQLSTNSISTNSSIVQPQVVQEEPIMTLYDLFDMNVQERSQIIVKAKHNGPKRIQTRQPTLFDLPFETAGIKTESPKLSTLPINSDKSDKPDKIDKINQPDQPEIPMEPRPYTGMREPHHQVGSLVKLESQVGYLSEVYKSGATFTPIKLSLLQQEKAILYIDLRDVYQRLYIGFYFNKTSVGACFERYFF